MTNAKSKALGGKKGNAMKNKTAKDKHGNPRHRFEYNLKEPAGADRMAAGCVHCGESEGAHYN